MPLEEPFEEIKVVDTVELPAHYYQYKGHFARCAAIQIIFEYLPLKELITMQQISQRFYKRICLWICPPVPMPKRKGFTELMKTQTSRVMIFY